MKTMKWICVCCALCAVVLSGTNCSEYETVWRDTRCDDDTDPVCAMVAPTCEEWEILAYQNSCYECVNPISCVPWGQPGCQTSLDCADNEYCNGCATGSCPGCDDCVPACLLHDCPTEDAASCLMERPLCAEGQISVVRDGCWVCVDFETCEDVVECQLGEERLYECLGGEEVPWCTCADAGVWDCIEDPFVACRDTRCDDGTQPLCNMLPPVCAEEELLAYQDHCYACVNPATCAPWGEPGCASDQECRPDEHCNPCGTSSCAFCDDCLPACQAHGCSTEFELLCTCARPECSAGAVSVIADGCWICVDAESCEPTGEGC